ncbi:unnamed protein product [Rhodiola kirilowii]
MSREGSHHDYQDDDEINLYERNDEVPLPFVDDPEQLIRNRRARDREAIRRNQEPPEDQNAAGPVQPLDIHHPLNLDKCRDENPLSMTTTEITITTVNLHWESSRHQISEFSRGAFTKALNWKISPSTLQWHTTYRNSQERVENQQ